MINPDMIPPEVVEAACRAYTSIMLDIAPELAISEAIAAALAAWPGAFPWTFSGPLDGTGYVIPLPQEVSDG